VILASLLWFKEQNTQVTQTTIIEHTKLDKMTISKSLKSLQQNGYIIRFENEIDTRAKTIVLNNSGEELAIKALKAVENVDKVFFAKLDNGQRNQLNLLFNLLS
jgi:DNA-binding MarR family transcriptional regulator